MKTLMKIAVLAAALFTAPAFAADAGHYERIDLPAPSLAGNLSGDPAVRKVSVYLPPGYARKSGQRYPVLYLLHGFTDSDANWFGLNGKHFVRAQTAADAAFAAGVPEMIIVMPDALTKFQGSMYASSAVNGDWETFITRELVAYVDGHYRTVAQSRARGLAGHSMGGYGTLRLAMKAPGVFSSIYAMSPCCLGPVMAPEAGMLASAAKIRSFEEIPAADFMTKAMLASAAAWSPNPRKPPLYIDLPMPGEPSTPEVLAEWNANSPVAMLHQYLPALKSYRAIAIDSGDQDPFIRPTVTRMHELLDGYSIKHEYEIYPGDHVNHIEERLTQKVLPFFGRHLDSQAR
jgi:S-formylglutathione hydrolase FrmB